MPPVRNLEEGQHSYSPGPHFEGRHFRCASDAACNLTRRIPVLRLHVNFLMVGRRRTMTTLSAAWAHSYQTLCCGATPARSHEFVLPELASGYRALGSIRSTTTAAELDFKGWLFLSLAITHDASPDAGWGATIRSPEYKFYMICGAVVEDRGRPASSGAAGQTNTVAFCFKLGICPCSA